MWRMASSLVGRCVYSTQKVTYCDIIRASVNELYRNGRKVFSAYVGADTKVIYRSESARMIYMIQMSAEIYHFEESGEIIFHKLINSFLPEVFKRWRESGAHHIITIILFTRTADSSNQRPNTTTSRDYYRVVVDQEHTSQWSDIMANLRREFSIFARDVLQQADCRVRDQILPSVKGNLLEAISLATAMISSRFVDRDLRHSNVQVVVVTPGTGIYNVDYDLLYQTSSKLLSIEIGVDLVCLSRTPLHVTPLFRYKDKRSSTIVHCIPSWLDISFWNNIEKHSNKWVPRCKIYELQMMGVMENELSAISIDYLPRMLVPVSNGIGKLSTSHATAMMDDYDANQFINNTTTMLHSSLSRFSEETVLTQPPALLLKPKVSAANLSGVAITKTHNLSELHRKPSLMINAAPTPVPDSAPATAILSSPILGTGETAAAFAQNIASSRPKMSALSSLLSLGIMNPGKSPKSPMTQHAATNTAPYLTPLDQIPPIASVLSTSDLKRPIPQPAASISIKNPVPRPHISRTHTGISPTSSRVITEISKSPARHVNSGWDPLSTSPVRTQKQFAQSRGFRNPSEARGIGGRASSNALIGGSRASRAKLDSFNSESLYSHESDPEPGEIHHMWVVVQNPSNLHERGVYNISNYGRWQNVFPDGVKRRSVKWRSLKAPASLPLSTGIFPTLKEFESVYTFQTYSVSLDPDQSEALTTGQLLHEMIAMRMSIGFQVAVGERVHQVEAAMIKHGGNPSGIVQIVAEDAQDPGDIRIYMTRSNQIHRLAVDYGGYYSNINVHVYTRSDIIKETLDRSYTPLLKSKYSSEYQLSRNSYPIFDASVPNLNWNQVDQVLAGYQDAVMDDQKIFRIRLVLIPVDIPKASLGNPLDGHPDKLNPEEIRLEGLRRLMSILSKGTYLTREDKERKRKVSVPEIKFYTGDLGSFLLQLLITANEDDSTSRTGRGVHSRKDSLFVKSSERFSRNIKLAQLAIEMQSDKGVRLVDRRWHWKTHAHCFVGQEFVAWMLDNFKDIETSEEAVEYGNKVMGLGLFHHVENRHTFLDGHYFYQLEPEFVIQATVPERPSWFKRPATGGGHFSQTSSPDVSSPVVSASSPSSDIPSSGHSKSSGSSGATPILNPQQSTSEIGRKSSTSSSSSTTPKVLISRALKYDLDPMKRASRLEVITFHVDRVHNPENVFQLRLEWLNATPRFIDDAINGFSRILDRYGLKIVQIPMEEISRVPESNPFTSLVHMSPCLSPEEFEAGLIINDPEDAATIREEASAPSNLESGFVSVIDESPLLQDTLYYHKYCLKHLGFVLDTVPAHSLLKKEIAVEYSWGKPYYNHVQYIHKSGTLIAQIIDEKSSRTFCTMINHLCVTRTGSGAGVPLQSTSGDPVVVQDALQHLCNDKDELLKLYEQARAEWDRRLDIYSDSEVSTPTISQAG